MDRQLPRYSQKTTGAPNFRSKRINPSSRVLPAAEHIACSAIHRCNDFGAGAVRVGSLEIGVTFHATILTLYPEMFPGPLGVSLAGKALGDGLWSCTPVNIRDFATDRHRSVDDTPAGGGAGMVLRADVIAAAVDAAPAALPVLALTPRGKPITQARVRDLASGPGVTLLCGRFEGFDERLFEARPHIEQVSVGDIVLSGGEPAALMILDACIRLLPGVMGAPSSGDEESFERGLLEYPHYTRPAEWEGRTIPEVLRSGDHAKITAWRKHQAEDDTRLRRPDLWERHTGARAQPASDARRKTKKDK
jgi:tRNA (guanine37-N1)-methyltransferase